MQEDYPTRLLGAGGDRHDGALHVAAILLGTPGGLTKAPAPTLRSGGARATRGTFMGVSV